MGNVVFTFNFGIEYANDFAELYYLDKEAHYEADNDYLEYENMKLGQIKIVNKFSGRYTIRADNFEQAYNFIKRWIINLNNDATYQQNMLALTLYENNHNLI